MIKRIFDFFFTLVGIILLLPFFILIIIIILIDMRGNPFYLQKRVGKDRKEFLLIKFRTMKSGSDKMGLITVGGRDPRITRSGYILRKYKLDEIPQLWNIIIGNMSIVGPRPEVKKYVDMYDSNQLKVLSVRPGLTDYASLTYINENELLGDSVNPENTYINEIMPAKLLLGLKYINEMSFRTDIKIIFQTLKKILR